MRLICAQLHVQAQFFLGDMCFRAVQYTTKPHGGIQENPGGVFKEPTGGIWLPAFWSVAPPKLITRATRAARGGCSGRPWAWGLRPAVWVGRGRDPQTRSGTLSAHVRVTTNPQLTSGNSPKYVMRARPLDRPLWPRSGPAHDPARPRRPGLGLSSATCRACRTCARIWESERTAGRGPAWLRRLTGGQESGGSNPPVPTS
jgi:hypothetical protein